MPAHCIVKYVVMHQNNPHDNTASPARRANEKTAPLRGFARSFLERGLAVKYRRGEVVIDLFGLWTTAVRQQLLLEFHQLLHLLQEPGLDKRPAGEIVYVGALSDRLVENELALASGMTQQRHQFS